jgi:hypothetical protein
MNVSNVSGGSSVGAIDLSSLSDASSTTSAAGSDGSQVSDFAKLMQELDELQKSDPDKFKAVTESIADQLKQAAAGANGPQANFLDNLAGKFDQASQTGSLDPLKPSGAAVSGHQGGHHHVHKYAQQQGAGSQQPPAVDVDQIIQSALDAA